MPLCDLSAGNDLPGESKTVRTEGSVWVRWEWVGMGALWHSLFVNMCIILVVLYSEIERQL